MIPTCLYWTSFSGKSPSNEVGLCSICGSLGKHIFRSAWCVASWKWNPLSWTKRPHFLLVKPNHDDFKMAWRDIPGSILSFFCLASNLNKINGTFAAPLSPPHPPNFNDAKMARFCSFALQQCFGGKGLIVLFYSVQDCSRQLRNWICKGNTKIEDRSVDLLIVYHFCRIKLQCPIRCQWLANGTMTLVCSWLEKLGLNLSSSSFVIGVKLLHPCSFMLYFYLFGIFLSQFKGIILCETKLTHNTVTKLL